MKKPTRTTKNEGSKVALRDAKTYAHLNVRRAFGGTVNERRKDAKRGADFEMILHPQKFYSAYQHTNRLTTKPFGASTSNAHERVQNDFQNGLPNHGSKTNLVRRNATPAPSVNPYQPLLHQAVFSQPGKNGCGDVAVNVLTLNPD